MVNTASSSTFIFIGDQRYLKDKAIQDIKSRISGPSKEILDYRLFYGGETPVKDILEYASTFPFLSPKKLIVLRDFEKMSKDERLHVVNYLKKPAKHTYFILEAKDDSVLNMDTELRRRARVTKFGNPTEREVESWIKNLISDNGKTIDADAVALLKELHGSNILYLRNELDKIITASGSNKKISAGDVEKLAGRSFFESAFELGWAVAGQKCEDAIKLVSEQISAGKKPYEVIGLLSWHFKKIIRAQAMRVSGRNESYIAGALKIVKKHHNDFFEQVKLFGKQRLEEKLDVLLEADMNIKRAKFAPSLVLELAIIRLCLG